MEEKQLLLKDLCARLPYGVKTSNGHGILEKIKKFLVRHNIIKGNFYAQGMIYIATGEPSKEPTDMVKWLNNMQVHCYYKEKDNKFFNMLGELYPEYKGYFYLY